MIQAYKIGVSIAMTNGVSAVLKIIQKDILGLKKQVDLTTGGLNRMKVAAVGFAAVTIGGGMLAGLYELSKAGEKYTHQLEMMKTAGMSVAEQQQAIAAANRVASTVMTTTPTENLKAIQELRGALNSAGANPQAATEEAIKYLALVQQAQAVMQTTAGGRAMAAQGGVYEMVKALEEIRATQNPERFASLLGGMVQASEAFGGKINARDWFQTLKYTRTAGQFYSDDFIAHYLPTLMQEMKAGGGSGQGGGPGASLASLFQAVVGNTFGIKTRDLGLKLGLINPALSTLDAHGRIHNQPGAWYGADEAASNPALWIQHVFLPKLSAQMHGHMLDIGANGQYVHLKEVATTLATLFGNRTAQQMVGLLMNVQKMEGDKKLVTAAMNLGAAYNEIIRMDPPTVRQALQDQFERVTTDLGKSMTPATTYLLFRLAEGLSYLAEVIERHPVITQWLMTFIAGLGVFLVVFGTLAVGAAAIAALGSGGLIAAAIAGAIALTAVLAMLPWGAIWEKISSVATGLWSGAKSLAINAKAWFGEIIASLKADILAVAVAVAEGLRHIITVIKDWIVNLGSAIGGLFRGGTAPNPPGMPYGVPSPTAYHPTGRSNHVKIENIMYLDGEPVYLNVKKRASRDMARPPTAANREDSRLNLLYAT